MEKRKNVGKLKWFKSPYFIIILMVLVFVIIMSSIEKTGERASETFFEDQNLESRLDAIYENIRSGGPPADGIPPIENPKYISMEEADKNLDNRDVVFVAELGDKVLIYPQKILVWHEIVNEEIDGEKVTISYCPLTGSAIGFKGKLSFGETDFGTSGKLSNSNLVMYDRETGSYWPQILGMAVSGDLKGQRLEEFPVIFTRWENAKVVYGTEAETRIREVKVLSENTGYIRNYNSDPYGSYLTQGNYYDSGRIFFPVMNQDSRFKDKEVVMGGRIIVNGEEKPFAILKSSVRDKGSMEFEIAGEGLRAVYDESLDTVRVFRNSEDSEELVNTFDVMWFAWVAFYPETEVFE